MSSNTRASARDLKHGLSAAEFEKKCKNGLVLDSAAITRRPQKVKNIAASSPLTNAQRTDMNSAVSVEEQQASTAASRRAKIIENLAVLRRKKKNSKPAADKIPGATCARVFHITEMAEHICASLDLLSILRARHVNHDLRETIAGSTLLGSIIFLSAMDSPPEGTPAVRVGSGNAVTQQLDPDDEAPEPPSYVLFNPFVFDPPNAHYPIGTLTISDKFANWVTNTSDEPFPLLDDMFLTNPPVTDLAIYLAESTYDGEIQGE